MQPSSFHILFGKTIIVGQNAKFNKDKFKLHAHYNTKNVFVKGFLKKSYKKFDIFSCFMQFMAIMIMATPKRELTKLNICIIIHRLNKYRWECTFCLSKLNCSKTEVFIMAEVMLTKEGKEELEKRLEFLKVVKRAEITERIKTAREFGDLSENAEYDAAKNEQAMLEGEIQEIEYKLKYAVIIKDGATKKGTVSLGSKVDFVDDETGENFSYEIVGTTEADVELGRISNESPIGNALLGRKAGDKINVVVPAGITSLTIKKVY